MCGIAGATGNHGDWIRRATRCIHHRGPDREAVYESCEVQLGHARLAVIDLSPDADQPMFNDDRSLAIVFNGEMYNFAERRRELEAEGHRFRTRSDTEVLLKLYELHGPKCLDRVKGMFALAIWEFAERRLFLARDRMGEKPLYYARLADGNLLFASEIKAILQHDRMSREVDLQALNEYLTYLYVPGSRTMFRRISKLLPGESLTWTPDSLTVDQYWHLPLPATPHADEPEISDGVRRLLRRSVSESLVADVPVGVFLSGGVDSSAIVATAAEFTSRLKTFTVIFDGDGSRYDEREPARQVASQFGAEHHELRVSGDTASFLPVIVEHFDQPFGNPTALLTYQISQETRRHVTVVIGGDGGDEVFGGYPRYRGIQLAEQYRRVPAALRQGAARLSHLLPESTSGFHAPRRAREFLAGNAASWEDMYCGWIGYFDDALKAKLYTPRFRASLNGGDPCAFLRRLLEPATLPFLDRAMRADVQSFLPYNVLEYGDKMSMAHGLELRLPLLDADLVSFMARLPGSIKMKGGRTKHLLKEAIGDKLPASFLDRRKIGFNPPMGVWLDKQLRPTVDEYLSPEQVRARGYFDPDAIAAMRHAHARRRRDYSLHLWSLVVLEQWHRAYID